MKDILFDLNDLRVEISFKSFEELRLILGFYQRNEIYKINFPCKNSIKKDFLLDSIKISREEFPDLEIIPHFSIYYEFMRNKNNTQNSFIKFLKYVNNLGCRELLLVSGSQKRSTLDSVSSLSLLRENPFFYNNDIFIGVAFNPYLPSFLFEEEIIRLEKKLQSGLVKSIWIQFGTDYNLFESRIDILKSIILTSIKHKSKTSNIKLYGSVLIPSKQFLARFKFRPWKGVYCSKEFLGSVEKANEYIKKLLIIYKQYNIFPLIETNSSTEDYLKELKKFF